MSGSRSAGKIEPMKLMMVTHAYPPVIGGAEMHAAQLSAELRRRGHDVSVMTTAAPRPPRRLPPELAGPTLIELTPGAAHKRFAVQCCMQLVRLRRTYSVAHFFLSGTHTMLGAALAAAMGKRVLVMFGGPDEIRHLQRTRLGRAGLRLLRAVADRIVILNSQMRDELEAFGFKAGHLAFLPCGIDPGIIEPASGIERTQLRDKWEICDKALVIAVVSRFVPEKRIEVVVQAFAQVRRSHPSAFLMLAGGGPELPKLIEESARLGLASDARFLGPLGREQVSDVLRLADLYVLASDCEGIPLAVMEAMAAGLPCVVSDIPGTEELVDHGREGYRVQVGDAAGLAAAFDELLREEPVRRRMGAAARLKVVERYSLDAVTARHERLYGELLRAGQSSKPVGT